MGYGIFLNDRTQYTFINLIHILVFTLGILKLITYQIIK